MNVVQFWLRSLEVRVDIFKAVMLNSVCYEG
jgi:hypothetical protein